MLDLAWNNLWQRKLRSVLTLLGITAALQLVILLTAILDLTERSMDDELAKYSGAGQLYVTSQSVSGLVGQEFPPINGTLRQADATAISDRFKARIDLARTTPILFRQLAAPPFPNAPPQALLVGLNPESIKAYLGDEAQVSEGELAFSGPRAMEVILGDLAALAFPGENTVGSEISVAGESLRVVGRLHTESELDRVASNPVLMPLQTAQAILSQEGSVSTLLITAASLADVAPTAADIRAAFPKLSVATQAEMAASLNDALAGQRQFFAIINNTVYAVAAVMVLIVMVMAVSERTREIGTLRAIGATRANVLTTIVFEAFILGVVAGVVAVPLAFLLDAAVGFGLSEVVRPWTFVQVALVVSLLSALAALLPAWRATRISPVEALRYE